MVSTTASLSPSSLSSHLLLPLRLFSQRSPIAPLDKEKGIFGFCSLEPLHRIYNLPEILSTLPTFAFMVTYYATFIFILSFPKSFSLFSIPSPTHTWEFFKVKVGLLVSLSLQCLIWNSPMLKPLIFTITQRTLKTFMVLKIEKDFISCHIALSKISSLILIVGIIWTSLLSLIIVGRLRIVYHLVLLIQISSRYRFSVWGSQFLSLFYWKFDVCLLWSFCFFVAKYT